MLRWCEIKNRDRTPEQLAELETQIKNELEIMTVFEKNPFAEYLIAKGRDEAIAEETRKVRSSLLSLLSKRLEILPVTLIQTLEECENLDLLRDVFGIIADNQDQEVLIQAIQNHLKRS